MSKYEPITTELREWAHTMLVDGVAQRIDQYCDAIDAVHRNLEQESETLQDENDGLQESVRRLMTQRDERLAAAERAAAECKTISTTYVDVKLRIDWERMACEFEQFADVVRGMAGGAESTPPTPDAILREFADKLCELCRIEYDSDETREELRRQYTKKLARCLGA